MQTGRALSHVIGANTAISPKECTDIELLALIAKGDESAMRALFGRHRVQVYRFSLRLTDDQATAEDLVSEVFLEAWRHAGTFEARSMVSTWLLAIARHLAWSKMRRRSTMQLDDAAVKDIEDCADNPEIVVQKRQQNAVLAHCLTKLSPAHREVIDLVYYHEKSIIEVAEIIGIPQSTVKTRMFYARKEIENLLKQFEINRTRPAKRTNRPCNPEAGERLVLSGSQSALVH